MKWLLILLAPLVFALSASAQIPCGPAGVTVTVDPQLAPLGEPFQLTLTNDSSQPITFFSSCLFEAVYRNNTCQGPIIFAPICLFYLQTILPGNSLHSSWDQSDDDGLQVTGGTYSFEIIHDSGSCCQAVTVGLSYVPALKPWGLSALVGLVGLAGTWVCRKRRALPE